MKKRDIEKQILQKLQRKQEERNRSHKNWKRHHNVYSKGSLERPRKDLSVKRQYKNYEKVFAPDNFSLNSNTEEVVQFISQLEDCYARKERVWVVLLDVETIDDGAVLALLSIMVQFKIAKIKFNGDLPKNLYAQKELRESGFFENLYRSFQEEERYCIAKTNSDDVVTHAWKKVDSELSASLIQQASNTIWGKQERCQGVQRSIIELMQNTNNHAEFGTKGAKHWWLYVNHDKKNKMVSFAFVDFGVGVFKSLSNKPSSSKFGNWVEKLSNRFIYGDNGELLKIIMSGEFHQTVTGKYYRGKGLPGIALTQKRNQISNLKIVTNDAFGDIDNNIFKKMPTTFNGTYLYWELGQNNEHCS